MRADPVLAQRFRGTNHIDACAAALPLPLAGEGWGGGAARGLPICPPPHLPTLRRRRLSLVTMRVTRCARAFRETRNRHPFTIDAIVVLPDHLHAIWTLPEGDADFRHALAADQVAFSRSLGSGVGQDRRPRGRDVRRVWNFTLLRNGTWMKCDT
jgi:REP element-mobilizing transposase RayT